MTKAHFKTQYISKYLRHTHTLITLLEFIILEIESMRIHVKTSLQNLLHSNCTERPSAPTSSCPGDYVPEYSPLSCTCTSSNLGNPQGSLVGWTSTSPSSAQLSLSNVTRSQDNHVYTCRLTWNSLDFYHNFTLRVACEFENRVRPYGQLWEMHTMKKTKHDLSIHFGRSEVLGYKIDSFAHTEGHLTNLLVHLCSYTVHESVT